MELYHGGTWGTVCDDDWDIDDDNVVCRQLGHASAIEYVCCARRFGEGSGSIHLDDVVCTGSESNLEYCDHREWSMHNCRHYEDAGVVCFGELLESIKVHVYRQRSFVILARL